MISPTRALDISWPPEFGPNRRTASVAQGVLARMPALLRIFLPKDGDHVLDVLRQDDWRFEPWPCNLTFRFIRPSLPGHERPAGRPARVKYRFICSGHERSRHE
ncbi:Hypothetical protein Deide_3p02301 (plasmid) [Deinococcus deserti VCD115]|uniref:Uncharacterized protein n=1 Tax=Deinococcus deserti (strain DSM 17065 / CIP 109153 / LMG 22923 / VCD115) TaxID=546414 RepID=C1D3W0_DEIDV|nr:Hypothetical protein Deide_3p02301 [Deinococcus deserti VCD115]